MSKINKKEIVINDLPTEEKILLLETEIEKREGTSIVWETKDKSKISLEKMDLNHLKNCLNMITRSVKSRQDWASLSELLPSSIDEIC